MDTVTITITGATDFVASTIGGDVSGTMNEDDAATLTATGALTVTDPNPGEDSFVAQSATPGTYGSFTLATDGAWSYAADNSQAAIQALNTGDTLTDSFTATTVDGTTQTVTLTINGDTDFVAATIGGDVSDSLTEDEASTLTGFGTLTVTDPNPGEASFTPQAGTAGDYGTFTLAANGNWTYEAENSQFAIQSLNTGDSLTDTFTAVTPDGTTQAVTITINGVTDAISNVELALVALPSNDSGFQAFGASSDDYAGSSVSVIGDVNGDGFDDVIVGAPEADDGNAYSGISYVVFGTDDSDRIDLEDLQTAGSGLGFALIGIDNYDQSGWSVSGLNDVNGDGLDDILVGAVDADAGASNTGETYVIFGKADDTPVDLADVANGAGASGFVINGIDVEDYSGYAVSSAGDVNGDGLEDILIGAPDADPNGIDSGEIYVVFGKADGAVVELSSLVGDGDASGFVINGRFASDDSGHSVAAAGDVNGDGLDDIILGVPDDDTNGSNSGAAFVVFGKADGVSVELSDVANSADASGFALYGVAAAADTGWSVGGGGDVNGDGLDDVIVGAIDADAGGDERGAAFVVFGKTDGTSFDLATVALDSDASGFVINGVADFDQTGQAVDIAGDINGDGLDDVIVGASRADINGSRSGTTSVVFGKSDGLGLDLSDIHLETNASGFALYGGAAFDLAGGSVSGSGDVNGDGFADIVIGADDADVVNFDDGAAYVVFGSNLTLDVSAVGTDGADALTGTAAAEVIFGAAGDDTIDGAGGDDRLNGGQGADTFVTPDMTGTTTVVDFDPDDDLLDLSAFRFGSFADFQAALEGLDYQGNVVSGSELPVKTTRITLDGDTTLLLDGVKPSELTVANLTPASTANVLLSQVAQNEGAFVINGINSDDYSGRSVSNAGDVNGDGLDDIIIGAPSADPNGAYSGQSYVVFGKADGGPVELSDVLAGTGGFAINGAATSDGSGYVGAGGDINGDGLDDLVVASKNSDFGASSNVGFASVIFGKADTATVELSDINAGTGGFAVVGAETFAGFPEFLSISGDVNGDGLDDLIFGAEEADPNGNSSGKSYVVFGKADGTAVDLADVEAETSGGFVVTGNATFDRAGRAFAAGDVNGDGLEDLVIGARGDDPNGLNSGAAFIVFGKSDFAAVALTDVEAGTGGFVINGATAGDDAGYSVAGIGDLNGDGLDDVVIGATDAAPNGPESGAAYVVFGKTDGTAIELASVAAGTGGFVINGADANDEFGERVSAAGDVNGDGIGDILISAPYLLPDESGTSYVIYGKADGAAVEASDIENGVGGFAIFGVNAYDYAGSGLVGGGDINGDGLSDVIVGAWGADPNGSRTGSTYVIFGPELDAAVDTFGTASSDTLTGTTTSEVIFGAAGDDTLDGGGGADRLSGGSGADTFVTQNVAGTTTVVDFIPDDDLLDVSAFGFANFAAFQAVVTGLDYQGNTVAGPELPVKTTLIALDGDTSILLPGIKPSDITAAQVSL
ncbi:MAG: VCBS domain-containing protein [Pseudomonadota bacterium]